MAEGSPAQAPAGPDDNVIQALLHDLHGRFASLDAGAPAAYIPELARADPADFGIVIATVDGRLHAVGDVDKPFTIQSISKPFAYGLALTLLGEESMARTVGVEPSGEAFNAISLDPVTGRPRNPMINAGAIATTARIHAHDPAGSERLLLEFFAELCGHPLAVDEAVFRSEQASGHRNRAIGHLLRNVNILEEDPERALELYFRQCALSLTCRDLAVMAATLACQGRNPFTGSQPLSELVTEKMLAVMATCGTYDFAGQWLHDVGMPAKSGVGGGLLAVVPGRLGIATYSPRLDALGTSVRGLAVCRALAEGLGLSLFDQYPQTGSTIRASYRGTERQSRRWRSAVDSERLQSVREGIWIVHVQGVLEFAAIERLLSELNRATADVSILILDGAHVTELPDGSRRLLARQLGLLRRRGMVVLLAHADRLAPGVAPLHGEDRPECFDRLDRAIERAEDLLLEALGPPPQLPGGAAHKPAAGVLALLRPDHRRALLEQMRERTFRQGEAVIRRGDPGQELFVVIEGRFSITAGEPGERGRPAPSRLATFEAGMVFGEVAFLSAQANSADVTADLEGRCWVLSRAGFDGLRQQEPELVTDLLLGLSRDLGQKLALSSRQLTWMEQL